MATQYNQPMSLGTVRIYGHEAIVYENEDGESWTGFKTPTRCIHCNYSDVEKKTSVAYHINASLCLSQRNTQIEFLIKRYIV